MINEYKTKFEVYAYDSPQMTWNEANKFVTGLGTGWRLPTNIELRILASHGDAIGFQKDLPYWSSEQHQGFDTTWLGFHFTALVKPVKDIL